MRLNLGMRLKVQLSLMSCEISLRLKWRGALMGSGLFAIMIQRK